MTCCVCIKARRVVSTCHDGIMPRCLHRAPQCCVCAQKDVRITYTHAGETLDTRIEGHTDNRSLKLESFSLSAEP